MRHEKFDGGMPAEASCLFDEAACVTREGLLERYDNDSVICVVVRDWSVEFHPSFEVWANTLDQPDAEALLAAVRVPRSEGPMLGRPLVDTITSSRHRNMKELRPGSTGRTEMRVLFAFDRQRKAILLLGGDKSRDWRGWYRIHIPIADDLFDEHQRIVDGDSPEKPTRTRKR